MREDTVNALLASLPNHMTSPAVLAYFDGAVSACKQGMGHTF